MTRPVESTRSIAIVASVLALAMMGTTLPTPLYPIYVRTFGLASVLVPVIFATYAAGVIAALLFLGYLSDEIGRRRMNEKAMSDHASKLLARVWKAAGATDIWTADRTAHTIGTCRMGTDADSSVVDPWGRSHDIDNLYICDNSVFPSALAANPALTIMALSLRTADRILAR